MPAKEVRHFEMAMGKKRKKEASANRQSLSPLVHACPKIDHTTITRTGGCAGAVWIL